MSISAALAAKPGEQRASSASREPVSSKGSDGTSGASAGMSMVLQSAGYGCPAWPKAGVEAKLPVGQVGGQDERHGNRVADAADSRPILRLPAESAQP